MERRPLLRRALFFCGIFLVATVALLPLHIAINSLGLVQRGLTARDAKGSIWWGSLRDARFGPVPLGDLNVGLRFLPILVGRATLDLDSANGSKQLAGAAVVSRHSFGVEAMTGTLDVRAAAAPLPFQSLELADLSFRFVGSNCRSAAGKVTATVNGEEFGLPLTGGLTGNARCDGGALLLPLASQGGVVRVNMRADANGRISVELIVTDADAQVAERLTSAGFRRTNRGYVLRTYRGF